MADMSKQIDVENILSYCDDLVEVLRAKRDVINLTRCQDHYSAIQSSFAADFEDVESSIRDYQKKIDDCKQRTVEARSSLVTDEDVDKLQKVLDEEQQREEVLQAELREIEEKIDELDQQRSLIEDRRRSLKKLGSDGAKARSKLSLYASVTNVIPNMDTDSKISGHIVKRDKSAVEMFEIDPVEANSFDACNSIWEMIEQ